MKIPSKVTSYKESTISKFPIVLAILKKSDMTPADLYIKVKKNKIQDITEFVEVLECLYVLNKIELQEGNLHYVG
ncbi:MAG: ABC-three component system middle component 7 [Succinivibrionaceae bacterium]